LNQTRALPLFQSWIGCSRAVPHCNRKESHSTDPTKFVLADTQQAKVYGDENQSAPFEFVAGTSALFNSRRLMAFPNQ